MPAAVWICLAVLLLAFAGGAAFAAVRALEAWRTLRRFRRAFDEATTMLVDSVTRLEDRVQSFETSDPRLQRSLERLARARAMLSLQLRVLQQARAPLTRLRAAVPRK